MISSLEACQIRDMYKTGNYTKKAIADLFHVHRDTITNVLERDEDHDVYVRTKNPKNLLIMPYIQFIKDLLSRGDMQATTIHKRILKQGTNISLSTVTKAVKKIKYELDISAIRYETTPGRQAQCDWGTFEGFSANVDGKECPLYGFFLILGYSRTKYLEFTTDMKTETLIRCIENALKYYGGCPEEILFDNMPQVVNRALIDKKSKDRALLPAFTAFSEYYGFDIRLARVRRPQEKGKVERFVGEFEKDFLPQLSKKTGHSLIDLNVEALAWCDEVNSRIHSTTNKVPFDRLTQEPLAPLPSTRYLDNKTITVNKDGTLSYRGEIYEVDNRFAYCTGEVIDQGNSILLMIDGELVILGRRDLPVYIRHYYSKTKIDWRLKQKHAPKVKPNSLINRIVTDVFDKIEVNWNTLTCFMKPGVAI